MTSRLSANTNLKLFSNNIYKGQYVYTQRGALIENYLEGCMATLDQALHSHPRTLAIRVDLRFPINAVKTDEASISRFMSSLRAQIKADQRHKANAGQRVHPCGLRFVWTREKDTALYHHYHVLLLLNADSYNCLGSYNATEGNMASRIRKAWASAIGVPFSELGGAVFFPANPIYLLNKNAIDYAQGFQNLFFRVSYFTKVATKQYGQKLRHFGRSNS